MSDTSEVASPAIETNLSIPNVSEKSHEPSLTEEQIHRESQNAIDTLVKSLKFNSEKELKNFIKMSREQQDSSKSELEKLQEKARLAEEFKAKVHEKDTILAEYAESALSTLSSAQKKSILAIAGEDPGQQLRVLEQMKRGGFLKQEDAKQEQAGVKASEKPNPQSPRAHTSQAPSLQKPAGPTETNALIRYRDYLKINPVAAANFYVQHQHEIAYLMQQEHSLAS